MNERFDRAPRSRASAKLQPSPLAIRVGWFVGIWGVSVGALGLVAFAIRWWIRT